MSTYTYVNLDAAITRGIEASAGLRPVRGLRVDAGYMFLDAVDLTRDRTIEGRERHRGTLRVTYGHEASGARVVLRAALTGKRPYYAVDGTRTYADAWVSLDLRYEQRIRTRATLFIGGDNLANAGSVRVPIRPRGFYAGVDLRL